MPSFLVCVKAVGYPWDHEAVDTDFAEAQRIATEMVTKPYMGEAAAVFEVGGTDALPTFTLRFQAKGEF